MSYKQMTTLIFKFTFVLSHTKDVQVTIKMQTPPFVLVWQVVVKYFQRLLFLSLLQIPIKPKEVLPTLQRQIYVTMVNSTVQLSLMQLDIFTSPAITTNFLFYRMNQINQDTISPQELSQNESLNRQQYHTNLFLIELNQMNQMKKTINALVFI